MSFQFGKSSQEKLLTCAEDLQKIAALALAKTKVDFSIISAYRGEDEQNGLVEKGMSKLRFPRSKHNSSPSKAYDFAPYVDGKLIFPTRKSKNYIQEMGYYYYIAGIMQVVAAECGVALRWGGNWDGDGSFADQKFHDLGHVELL